MVSRSVALLFLSAVALASCAFAAPSVPTASQDIGDQLKHTFLFYHALPLTMRDAQATGWVALDSCRDALGVPMVDGSGAPSTSKPIVLYYTASGFLSGVALAFFGDEPPSLIPDWYVPATDTYHTVTVSFRDPSVMCDPSYDTDLVVGDRLVINQDTTAFPIPVTTQGAIDAGWTAGACIGGMGRHYSFDTEHASLSYNASTLVPITPMYDDGIVTAFLFSTPKLQQHIPLDGPYEGPFPNFLWCKNWCSKDCDNFGKETSFWNSMHFMLRDHTLNKCDNSCP